MKLRQCLFKFLPLPVHPLLAKFRCAWLVCVRSVEILTALKHQEKMKIFHLMLRLSEQIRTQKPSSSVLLFFFQAKKFQILRECNACASTLIEVTSVHGYSMHFACHCCHCIWPLFGIVACLRFFQRIFIIANKLYKLCLGFTPSEAFANQF